MDIRWHTLDKAAWEAIKSEGEIVEQDNHGIKVLRCASGDFIKMFRIKGFITSARLFNPAAVFCQKAEKLQQYGIDTVEPVALYRLAYVPRFGVRYRPLAGVTVRALLKDGALTSQQIERVGAFIAMLHQKGIYFRSLHPGNIVIQPDGRLGLIDVLDCHFRWWRRPLNVFQRQRNFRHFFRYDDGKRIETPLRKAYHKACRTP